MKNHKSPWQIVIALCSAVGLFSVLLAETPPSKEIDSSSLKTTVTETDTTWTKTVTDESGKIFFKRTWDKNSGEVRPDGPPEGEKSRPGTSPIVKVATKKKPVEASKRKPRAPRKPPNEWSGSLELQSRLHSTDKDADKVSRKLVNSKDGIGIGALSVWRKTPERSFKLDLKSAGTWNDSMGGRLDFSHKLKFHVKARYMRTDWNYGTVLDPSTVKDRLTIQAALNNPEVDWQPRFTLSYRAIDGSGDILRLQGSTDQNFPRDRILSSGNPVDHQLMLGVSGSKGKLSISGQYGERVDEVSDRKVYVRDFDFNGTRDLIDLWKSQQNFSKWTTGRARYQFNDRYSFTVGMTTTLTDNEFRASREFYSPTWFGVTKASIAGYQGQDHGWSDGYARDEEYVFLGMPSQDWEVEARVERRSLRTRADGSLRFVDRFGNLTASEDSSTNNKIDEGLFETEVAFLGLRDTRLYGGYRRVEREELDDNSLVTFDYDAAGNRSKVASIRNVDRNSILETREEMAFGGFWRRFSKTLDADVRFETGKTTDLNRGGVAFARETLTGSYDRDRQVVRLRYRPDRDLRFNLRFKRDNRIRHQIGAEDDRRTLAFFADWVPVGRNFALHGGYSQATGDISLPTTRFRDEIETLTFGGNWRFQDRWTALLNYSQTVSGDVTRLDYQTGELRFAYDLKSGDRLSFGYLHRYYGNETFQSEEFTNHIFMLSYSIDL